MSLPKTIWWCSRHGSGQDYWEHIVPTCGAYKAGWSDPCVWTTLRVAGRDDRLIRRGDSIPDALVEEAAKRLRAKSGIRLFDYETIDEIDDLARAALSVLFPGEEEE